MGRSRSRSPRNHDRSRRRSRSRSNDRRETSRAYPSRNTSGRKDTLERNRQQSHESKYGKPNFEWGKVEETKMDKEIVKEKPNFGLSGALAQDLETGNTREGIVLKFIEPTEARIPRRKWRFYVFKKETSIGT